MEEKDAAPLKKNSHGLLQKAMALQNARNVIELENGIFSIKKNLELTNIPLNSDFKSLVDSVLNTSKIYQ